MASESSKISMPFGEFVTLMAFMISVTALSIDAILPALFLAGQDLGVSDINHTQYMVSMLLLGLTLGQLIYGPIADSFGRKISVYAGLVIFIAGSLLSLVSSNYEWMLIGRFLQGLGAASARVSSVAIVRDWYSGRDMARVLSFIMAVFIFVPVIAPALGELIILISHWRGIFIVFILIALAIQLWMYLRLPETLQPENRHPFSLQGVWHSLKLVLGNYQTLGHTISAGLIFGALIGYLTSARQIYQDYFHTGQLFVFYFGLSALSVGIASLVNSKIVKRYGMHRISRLALIAMMILSTLFLVFIWAHPGQTPLVFFMGYAVLTFFCMGLLFGNLNAMAMEPMAHLAGVASSVIGAITSALSVIVGTLIGQSYNNSLIPMVSGFLILAALSLSIQLLLIRINYIKNT